MATSTKWRGNQSLTLKMLGSNPTVVTTAELQKPRTNKCWAGSLSLGVVDLRDKIAETG